MLQLQAQDIPYDDPDSCHWFQRRPTFSATPGASTAFGEAVIRSCLATLQAKALEHHGLDHLQAFTDPATGQTLWLIEDESGMITALLPDEY